MESIGNIIAQVIINIADLTAEFWSNLIYVDISWWQVVLDILLVTIFVYYFFSFLKSSKAVSIIIGIIIIFLIFNLSQALNLIAFNWLIERLFTLALVAIPVIFQKELRAGLERLGKTPYFKSKKSYNNKKIAKEIAETCSELAKNYSGALLVFEKTLSLEDYINSGTIINGEISKELLISIFDKKGPLHDGAVIIKKSKIVAASCILPSNQDIKLKDFGTRHKAAVALTELSDAFVIVVSEERGSISYSKNGSIYNNVDVSELALIISNELN